MNFKYRFFAAAAFCGLFSCVLHAQSEHVYSMEKNSDFRATFQRDFNKVSYVPGGVTGRCFKAVVPADSKKGYAVHSVSRQYTNCPVELHVSGMFKGKGTFSIGFIVYNRQGKIYWITKAPGSYSPRFTIDSDQWEKKSFVFRPSEENVREITGFLTMVSLSPGSEIYMDDIRTKIVERPVTADSMPVIPMLKAPPPMDGKFNAEAWKPALELKLRARDGKSDAKEPGSILLRRDANTLYVAAVMKGEDVPALLKRKESDGRKVVWNVNRIEMFMGEKAYLQFMMDWMGRTYRNNEIPMFSKINHKKDAYIVRVAIPLKDIPRVLASDDIVNMNFYRQSASGVSCWNPNTGPFTEPDKMAPVLLDVPENIVKKLAGKARKTVSALAGAKSLTESDAAGLRALIAEKEKAALEKTGNSAEFLKSLADFNTIGSKISAVQQKNLHAKYGKADVRLAEESGKTVPELWKPGKLLGKDFWYAFNMIGKYSIGPLEQLGMMELPLYKEAMFHLWIFHQRYSEDMIRPDRPYYQYLQKYPNHPILVGCDRYQPVKNDRNAENLFNREYMEKFIRLYGHRLAGFGSPESFLNGIGLFLDHIRHWNLQKPRNRAEAYGVMKSLHDAVSDKVPEYSSFRNLALNSKYARKYAGYNATATTFNHMMHSLGDRISGNENGECCGPTPTKYAFARGAARQYGGIWENYQIYYGWAFLKARSGGMQCAAVSGLVPDHVASQLTPDCRVISYCYLNGLKVGTGLERQKALILHPYLYGAGIWRSEADMNELVCFYDMDTIEKDDPLVINLRDQKFHISPMAKINIHFYDNIAKKRDRGVTVTPVALVFDRHHGYFPLYLSTIVWGFFSPTEMEKVMWAIDSHIFKRTKDNSTYTTSPFGDIFDVITNDSKTDFLKTYQALYLTGDVTLDKAFAARLQEYVKAGGTLVVNAELLKKYNTLSPEFTGCELTEETGKSMASYSRLSGTVIPERSPYEYRVVKPRKGTQVLAVTADEKQNPAIVLNRVGKGRVIVTAPFHMKEAKSMENMLALFDQLMFKLRNDSIPVKVETPMQYSFNRNKTGWIVYLQNNSGLPPKGGVFQKPLKCDVTKVEKARITFPVSMGKVRKIVDWWTGKEVPFKISGGDAVAEVTLPGGDCCALEFILR